MRCCPVPQSGGLHAYSRLTKRLCFYIHEWLMKPVSIWYCRLLREQEGLAMNPAREMGVPAPRYISYCEPPAPRNTCSMSMPSLLMTQLPGTEMDALSDEKVDLDVVREDLVRIFTVMRRFANPWGNAICGVDSGPVRGPMVPASPLPASPDETAFHESLRHVMRFTNRSGGEQIAVARAQNLFSLPRHAVVFTHGDLGRHNIMIGPDGHVSGIFDWEAAAWLPEYWEVTVLAIFPRHPWGRYMHEQVASGEYAEELIGHCAVAGLTADSLTIR
ncbi:hypothetical protein OH77DRAFT_1577097 [Trametes cingulata]|nr:hypothetical protein OH77DRAFT_1577097 [Trametes cingulata]